MSVLLSASAINTLKAVSETGRCVLVQGQVECFFTRIVDPGETVMAKSMLYVVFSDSGTLNLMVDGNLVAPLSIMPWS